MKKLGAILMAITLSTPATAWSQTGIRAPQGWSFGFMGGAAAFTDLQRGTVNATRPTTIGLEQRELGRRISAETSTSLAAYLAFWPSRNWGLRLHATFSPTRFETLMKESEAEFAGLPTSSEEEDRLAGLDILTADLQGMFRLPTIKNRVMLYGIVGGGVARYEVKESGVMPAEAEGEFEGGVEIQPSGMFGLGAMLPLKDRAFRLHFELTNHMARTPLEGGEPQMVENPDAEVEIVPRDEAAGDQRVNVTSGVRFMFGLSFSPRR